MRKLQDQMYSNSKFETIGRATRISFQIILLLQVIIGMSLKNKGNCFFSVWYNIGYFSIIHWMPMINLNSGTELKSFLNELSYLFKPFSLPEICPDETINDEQYKEFRIETSGFINNAKEIIILYLFCLFVCIIILATCKSSTSTLWKNLVDQIKWNAFIRLHLVVFLDFVTFSLINIYYFSGVSICSIANLSISLILIIVGGSWIALNPVWLKMKMNSNREEHHSVVFKQVSTLVNEFKPVFEISKYQFYTIFLLYRFSLALNFVLLSSSPSVQILLMSSFQVLIMLYLGISKPFNSKADAYTVFASETLMLLFVLVLGFRSLNNVPDSVHYSTSIFCVCIVWLIEFVIVLRFFLNIKDARSITLQVQNTSTISPVQDNFENGSSVSYKASESAYIPHINNTELNENIEVYNPNQAYKYLQTKKVDNLKDSFSGRLQSNLPPIMEIVTKKSVVIPDDDPNTNKDKSAFDSTEILQGIDYSQFPDNDSNSPRIPVTKTPASNSTLMPSSILTSDSIDISRKKRSSSRMNNYFNTLSTSKNTSVSQDSILGMNSSVPGMKRSEVIEDSKIKEFLAKASETSIKVGNKGLS